MSDLSYRAPPRLERRLSGRPAPKTVKFSRFGLFGFLVLTLAAGLNVAALYTAEQRFAELREAGNWVRHTRDAENLIAHIYRKSVDAETGQRGFLLTQDETYLNPYLDARVEIPRTSRRLASSPGQSRPGRATRHDQQADGGPHGPDGAIAQVQARPQR